MPLRCSLRTRPITEAHAVALLELAAVIDIDLTAEAIDGLLAHCSSLPVFTDNFQVIRIASEDESYGLEMVRQQSDDEPTQVLAVEGSIIRIRFHDYRGWKVSRDLALGWLRPLQGELARLNRRFISVGICFTDQFERDGISDYSVEEVFNAESRYFPRMVVGGAPAWRSHTKWLCETEERDVKLLADLYIKTEFESSAASADDGTPDPRHVSQIEHKQQVFCVPESDGDPAEIEFSRIEGFLNYLHVENKSMMRSLLTDDMSNRIGLR